MWWLCVFILLRAMHGLAHDGDTKTVQYTSDAFASEVPQKNHFVMFFAPWCGHCSRLAPTWEKLSEKFNVDENRQVTIAKVDCTVETSLCSDQDVTGYPTLKFFKVGDLDGVKFRGTRDLPSLSTFVNEQLGNTVEESEKPKVPDPVNGLVELTEDTFENHVARGKHFVKFYAPWCGHCQKLAPTWDSLAKSFEHDTIVSVAKVDCTLHRGICNTFDIVGYPTLLWIEDGKKVEKYQGQRTHEELKAFISRMLGPSENSVSDEENDQDGGSPVIVFSGENFEHGIAKGITFVKFFAPWCGHCKRLAPTWEELGKKFVANNLVKVVKVDCTQDISKDLCNEQEEALIRTRNPVERTYGVWKRRFPVLATGIRLKLDRIQSIIMSTALLHNIACIENEDIPPVTEDQLEAINAVHDLPQEQNFQPAIRENSVKR